MESLDRKDLEEGMTYVVEHMGGNAYVFRHKQLSKSDVNIVSDGVIGMRTPFIQMKSNTEITTTGYMVRRATVEEDVWLEECEKAEGYLTKEQAIANFNKRFVA